MMIPLRIGEPKNFVERQQRLFRSAAGTSRAESSTQVEGGWIEYVISDKLVQKVAAESCQICPVRKPATHNTHANVKTGHLAKVHLFLTVRVVFAAWRSVAWLDQRRR